MITFTYLQMCITALSIKDLDSFCDLDIFILHIFHYLLFFYAGQLMPHGLPVVKTKYLFSAQSFSDVWRYIHIIHTHTKKSYALP